MSSVELKVKENIIKVLNLGIAPEELESSNLIESYGINSVDALEILIHIENEFDIEVDEEHLNAELINEVSALVEYIEEKQD